MGFARKLFPEKGKRVTVSRIFTISAVLATMVFFVPHLPVIGLIAWLCLLVTGPIMIWRLFRFVTRRTIWRLRNRLIVTYVFIGMVPLALLLILVGIAGYVLAGQTAVDLVITELNQTMSALKVPGRVLALNPSAPYENIIPQVAPFVKDRFPNFEIVAQRNGKVFHYPADSKLTPSKADVPDYTGLTIVDGHYFAWSHSQKGDQIIDVAAPIDQETLAELVPGLGRISISGDRAQLSRRKLDPDQLRAGNADAVPPPGNQFDYEVTWFSPMSIAEWGTAQQSDGGSLWITTRPSALLRALFAEKFEIGQALFYAFLGVAIAFLLMELVSFIIGISLTRSITGAISNLYQGTQLVAAGDFSHRIAVKGNDQLAAVSQSFNGMTERIEQLVIVEKEKERLQSELEIAREVQNQLFPGVSPKMKSLEITGLCLPARMVSGDYYDFLCLQETRLALAIGDVAGKGISAALLMASIQSIMRTQLSAFTPALAASANGAPQTVYSTSKMVSQLNGQLYQSTTPEKYATFLFGIYDERDRMFTYTNAGHLPPILIHRGEPTLLEVTGTVVGAFPTCVYGEQKIELEPNDLLVCYTDGITEPENEYGEEFGVDRLVESLVKNQHLSTDEMINEVMKSVRTWTTAPELPDDMTLLLARRFN